MKTYPNRRVDPKPGWIPAVPRKSKACADGRHSVCTMQSCTCECGHGIGANGETVRRTR